jgi:transposase InsO family protein
MYAQCGSRPKLATHLGVSTRTIGNWMQELRIHGTKCKPKLRTPEKQSKIAQWLKANPDARLIRSPKHVAARMGVNVAALESWLYRRKKRILQYVKTLGTLDKHHASALSGVRPSTGATILVPPRAIAICVVDVDWWTLDVSYSGNLKAGLDYEVVVPYAQIKDFWKKETNVILAPPATDPPASSPQ